MPTEFHIPSISTKALRVIQHFEGGFGRVFIIADPDGNKYALKTLKWELSLDKTQLAEEIVKLVSIPTHPNVIQVRELHWQDQIPYMLMSFHPANLRTDIVNHKSLHPSHLTEIISQVANGLEHIHSKAQMLHLDLKPENILKSSRETYLISDFGIARVFPATKAGDVRSQLFASGIVGTLAYMSPEQIISNSLTAKCDIFSFGIIIYELLTGKHPFVSDSANHTVHNILLREVKFSLSERFSIPGRLRDICLACLQKNSEYRPTASQVVASLEPASKPLDAPTLKNIELEGTINKANTLMGLGSFSDAEELLRSCLASNPWFLTARINLAECLHLQRRFQEAIQMADEAIRIFDWTMESPASLSTLLVNLANYLMAVDPKESAKYSHKAIELDPSDWQALGNLAEVLRVLGASDRPLLIEAEEIIKRALTLNPNDVKLRTTYCGILLELGDHERLNPLLVKLINEVGDHDIHARLLLVRALLRTGQVDDAERWLQPMRSISYLKDYFVQLDEDIRQRRLELARQPKK